MEVNLLNEWFLNKKKEVFLEKYFFVIIYQNNIFPRDFYRYHIVHKIMYIIKNAEKFFSIVFNRQVG